MHRAQELSKRRGELELDLVQLSGNESPPDIAELTAELDGIPIMLAVCKSRRD